jgi:hypothetical protein
MVIAMSMRDGDGMRGIRSLDVVERVVDRERQAQLQHFDALDSKAGVMLGFAGALAALAPAAVNGIVDGGRFVAVGGALMGLWAFWPRSYGAVTLRALRGRYLASEPAFARIHLTDTQIAVAEELAATLDRKALRVKLAMSFLAASSILVAAGLLVH